MRRRGKKSSAPAPVGQLLEKLHLSEDFDKLVAICRWWHRQVPSNVRAHASPARVSGGVLIVHTRSAPWAQELSLQSEALLNDLRQHCPKLRVDELRFRIGPLATGALQAPSRRGAS